MDNLVIAKAAGFCNVGDIIKISGTAHGYGDGLFTVVFINTSGDARLFRVKDEKIAKKRKYSSVYIKSHKRVW